MLPISEWKHSQFCQCTPADIQAKQVCMFCKAEGFAFDEAYFAEWFTESEPPEMPKPPKVERLARRLKRACRALVAQELAVKPRGTIEQFNEFALDKRYRLAAVARKIDGYIDLLREVKATTKAV